VTCIMKKMFLLLGVVSLSAQAAWQLVHTDASNAKFFIDQTHIELVEGYQRIWVMNSLESTNAQGARSFRSVEEYDCIKKMGRVMQIAAFDGEMGQGNVLARRHGNGQWQAPDEDSVDKIIMNEACKSAK
jgi:hypothetical protein